MNSFDLKEAMEDICIKNALSLENVVASLKSSFLSMLSETFNLEEDDIIVEEDEGIFQIYYNMDVEEKVGVGIISLEEAQKHDKDIALGSTIKLPLDLTQFDRKKIIYLNRNIRNHLSDIQQNLVFEEIKEKEGTIVTGTVIRKRGRDYFINIGKLEGRMPFQEQNPRDYYNFGDKFKLLIKEVSQDDRGRPYVLLSRADVQFVEGIFEMEVPEIQEGAVKIKNMVRDVGSKVKVSVYATKHGVEPVGTCVGFSGVRIKEIIKEIGGERIDVIPYMENIRDYITRALQPAKIQKVVVIDEDRKEAVVIVDDDNYPLAVGKGGGNVMLACRLVGWKVNIKTISQIERNPSMLEVLSKVEGIATSVESDLQDLEGIDEAILLKFMKAGITSISELYEKPKGELLKIEGVTEEDVSKIREVLGEMVEVVEDKIETGKVTKAFMGDLEDVLYGISEEEEIVEEIEQIEYLTCPKCNFEFEYRSQNRCPACKVEFEFEEE